MKTKTWQVYLFLIIAASLAAVFLAKTAVATAGSAILACEGRIFNNEDNPQYHTVGISLSNFNDMAPIRIMRIVAYDWASGDIICDSALGDIDARYDIPPNGGKYFPVTNCSGFPATQHFNMKIYYWSPFINKNSLYGNAVTRIWDRGDPVREVARAGLECIPVK
jgi:hypothetical protein